MKNALLAALVGLALLAAPAVAADYAVPDRPIIDQCPEGFDLVIKTETADRTLPSGFQLFAGDRLFYCVTEGDSRAALEAMMKEGNGWSSGLPQMQPAPTPATPPTTPVDPEDPVDPVEPTDPGETCVTIPGDPIKERVRKYREICTPFGCFTVPNGWEWVVVGHEPDEEVCTPNDQ